MTALSPDLASPDHRDQRLLGFLLLSMLLHALWLAWPIRGPSGVTASVAPSLAVHLVPIQPSPSVEAQPPPGMEEARHSAPPRRAWQLTRDHGGPHPEFGIAPGPVAGNIHEPPAIDLDAARALARSVAKATATERRNPYPAALPLTIESAIAQATQTDLVVESRGAAGEWVTRHGKSRCVTPLQVPFFMEGKSMLTQCDVAKK
jgi:hypothetical protein